jgi:DNA-binding transcriptional LysR family regulator
MFLGCEFIRTQKGFPLTPAAALTLEKLETILPESNSATAKKLTAQISYRFPIAAASTG